MNEEQKLPSAEATVGRSIDAVGSMEVVESVEEATSLEADVDSVEAISGAKKSLKSRTMDKMATGASRILTKTKSTIGSNFMSIKKKGSALTCA